MILVIQNGYVTTFISRYLREPHTIIKSFEVDVTEIDLADYTFVIILGGYQSVTHIERYPYLVKVVALIKSCIELNKPMLGICLGCQLIAYALGCEIRSSPQLHIGYDVEILDCEPIFRCHLDYTVPNDKMEVLEYFEGMPYLYRHGLCIYGIQCHPDIAPEYVCKFSNHKPSNTFAIANAERIDRANQEVVDQLIDMLRTVSCLEYAITAPTRTGEQPQVPPCSSLPD